MAWIRCCWGMGWGVDGTVMKKRAFFGDEEMFFCNREGGRNFHQELRKSGRGLGEANHEILLKKRTRILTEANKGNEGNTKPRSQPVWAKPVL
jgi:hypothetical protein